MQPGSGVSQAESERWRLGMTAYVTGGDGHSTHYQPRCCCVTWVPPGSPSVDAAAAAAFVVPIATTTEIVIKMKHSQVIDILQSS